jgi:hypothetical protein
MVPYTLYIVCMYVHYTSYLPQFQGATLTYCLKEKMVEYGATFLLRFAHGERKTERDYRSRICKPLS